MRGTARKIISSMKGWEVSQERNNMIYLDMAQNQFDKDMARIKKVAYRLCELMVYAVAFVVLAIILNFISLAIYTDWFMRQFSFSQHM